MRFAIFACIYEFVLTALENFFLFANNDDLHSIEHLEHGINPSRSREKVASCEPTLSRHVQVTFSTCGKWNIYLFRNKNEYFM